MTHQYEPGPTYWHDVRDSEQQLFVAARVGRVLGLQGARKTWPVRRSEVVGSVRYTGVRTPSIMGSRYTIGLHTFPPVADVLAEPRVEQVFTMDLREGHESLRLRWFKLPPGYPSLDLDALKASIGERGMAGITVPGEAEYSFVLNQLLEGAHAPGIKRVG